MKKQELESVISMIVDAFVEGAKNEQATKHIKNAKEAKEYHDFLKKLADEKRKELEKQLID